MREGPESVDLPGHFVFHLLEMVSDITAPNFWKKAPVFIPWDSVKIHSASY